MYRCLSLINRSKEYITIENQKCVVRALFHFFFSPIIQWIINSKTPNYNVWHSHGSWASAFRCDCYSSRGNSIKLLVPNISTSAIGNLSYSAIITFELRNILQPMNANVIQFESFTLRFIFFSPFHFLLISFYKSECINPLR